VQAPGRGEDGWSPADQFEVLSVQIPGPVLILGVYCFRVFTRFETHQLSRKSDRSAESIYSNYADPDKGSGRS
jgi:hypothetical protein